MVLQPDSRIQEDAIAPFEMALGVEGAALNVLGHVGHAPEPARVRVIQPVHALGAVFGAEDPDRPLRRGVSRAERGDAAGVVQLRALVIGRGGAVRRIPVLDLSHESRDLRLERRARTETALVGRAAREHAVLLEIVRVTDLLEGAEGGKGRVRGIEEEIVGKLLLSLRRERAHLEPVLAHREVEMKLPVQTGVCVAGSPSIRSEA